MRSVTFRNALRIRAARDLTGDAPGPGDPGHPAATPSEVGAGAGTGVTAGEQPPRSGAHPTEPVGEARTVTPLRRGEADAVQDVVERLRAAYDALDGATVEVAVRDACEVFRQARIRSFVPILVERRARAVLDAATRRHRSAPRTGNTLSSP